MNEKPNIWKDAYQEARKRVREQFGIKGEIMKLAVAITGVTLAVAVLSASGLMKLFGIDYTIPQTIWYVLGGEMLLVLSLLILEPIVAFFRMFGVVNETFLRLLSIQEEVVHNLASKEANLLITKEINQADWTGIRVLNKENRYIEGVIKIESISESPTFSDSLELKRHGINTDTFKLTRDGHNDFDVAVINRGGKVGIPHHGGMHFFELLPGKYHLQTHLVAQFMDTPRGMIKPKIEYWRLVYSPNAKPTLRLTKIS